MFLKVKLTCIYKISIGDYYYIGKSTDGFSRWSSHYTLLKLNKHHSPKLQSMFNELGVTSLTFSILEYISITEYKIASQLKGKELKTQFNRYLLNREKWWMNKYSINFCLNSDDKHFS
jgi:hypothetical protein